MRVRSIHRVFVGLIGASVHKEEKEGTKKREEREEEEEEVKRRTACGDLLVVESQAKRS